MILFALYGNFKFPVIDCAGRIADRACGRLDRAEAHAHAVQRFVGSGAAGADRRIGRDRGDSGLLHQ